MRTRIVTPNVFYHIIGWIAFLAYEVPVTLILGSDAGILRFVAFYLLDILLFYINAHAVFQLVFRQRYAVLYLVPLVLFELAAFTGISVIVDDLVSSVEKGHLEISISKLDAIRSLWRNIYILGLSTAYWFIRRSIRNEKRANLLQIQRLEGEKREAALENAYLRAQINPHLLFNSLNYIYNSVVSISHKASEGILLLSDIMRYALTSMDADGKVALSREVEQVENYIYLNQLRFSNKLYVETYIDACCKESALRIPPLLLLTFVENMFKHGYLSDAGNPARIMIQCHDNTLCFLSTNTKRFNRTDYKVGHLGVHNAKTRLHNYYEKCYRLHIDDNDTTFTVQLTIRL